MLRRLMVGAVVVMAVCIVAAIVTRPLDRGQLPSSVRDVRAELVALHQGDGPCVRWHEPPTPDDAELDTISASLRRDVGLAEDMHVVLPLLAQVRLRNHAATLEQHARDPHAEYRHVALAGLKTMDRLRVKVRGDRVGALLPGLQRFNALDARRAQDRVRAERLWRHLTPEEREAAGAWVERWRVALSGAQAQAAWVHRVASGVTRVRMTLLARALGHFHRYRGRYPRDLPELLEGTARNSPWRADDPEALAIPPDVTRAMTRDGALRDGWLRSFQYYTLREGFRLISSGPSEGSPSDDLVLQGAGGQPPRWVNVANVPP